LKRFQTEREKALEELQSMARNAFSVTRIRKSDIDDARRQAEKFALQRDELNNSARRTDIPMEIRQKEEQIEKLKRCIEDDSMSLRELRRCAEENNAIEILQRQIAQDLEALDEMKEENSFLLQKYNVMPHLPANTSNDDLVRVMSNLFQEVIIKVDDAKSNLRESNEKVRSIESQLSKASALFNHKRHLLSQNKEQVAIVGGESRGVQRIKQITKSIRNFEISQGCDESEVIGSDTEPHAILEYLTNRIAEVNKLNTIDDQPEIVSLAIKRLKKLSRRQDDIVCPCCARSMDPHEAAVFSREMDSLADPINSVVIKSDPAKAAERRAAMTNYERWRSSGKLAYVILCFLVSRSTAYTYICHY